MPLFRFFAAPLLLMPATAIARHTPATQDAYTLRSTPREDATLLLRGMALLIIRHCRFSLRFRDALPLFRYMLPRHCCDAAAA